MPVRVRVRSGANGVVVVVALVIALPTIATAERIRRGSGRAVAGLTIRAVARACGIRFAFVGAERLTSVDGDSFVVVANHSSPVDIAALLAARPDLRFVAAAELFRLPLLGSAMRALGSVPVDRKRPTRSARLERVLDGRGPVVVFAEGGIPEPGEQRRFETGAFVLAIDGGAPIVPVTILGSAAVLPRGSRIWARPGTISIEFHDPIVTTDLTLADRKTLRDRTERIVRAGVAG